MVTYVVILGTVALVALTGFKAFGRATSATATRLGGQVLSLGAGGDGPGGGGSSAPIPIVGGAGSIAGGSAWRHSL